MRRIHGRAEASPISWFAGLYCIALLFVGALLTGLLTTLTGYLFQQAATLGHRLFADRPWQLLVSTPLIAMTVAWLTRKVFCYSEGSGIPQVIASLESMPSQPIARRVLGLRVMLGKLLLAPIAVFAGMSLGREGPTVQIGAGIMYGFRQLYRRQSDFWDKIFILAGAGAGLAGAFNAPIAGIVFAVEELTGRFWKRMMLPLLFAIVIALATVQHFDGDFLYFGQVTPGHVNLNLLPAVLLTGVVCGMLSGLFNYLVLSAGRWQRHYTLRVALLCGLVVALLNFATNNATFGDGREPAYQLLHGLAEPTWIYGVAKWLSTLFTYLCGIPGGLFSPSLSSAAGLAALLQSWLPGIPLPELALLCMVAYMAGLTHSPITAVVITLELTGSTSFAVPLVAVACIGVLVARQIAPALYGTLATRYVTKVSS